MKAQVSLITLGVRDLGRAKAFYAERLGWPVLAEEGDWVAFMLDGGSTAFALFPWDALAEDARVAADGSGFRGVTLAYNVRTEERVDEVLAEAEHAGGSIVKPAERAEWPVPIEDELSLLKDARRRRHDPLSFGGAREGPPPDETVVGRFP